jgi:hypothetical protein
MAVTADWPIMVEPGYQWVVNSLWRTLAGGNQYVTFIDT